VTGRYTMTPVPSGGGTIVRANVWTAKGYSSKTFTTAAEAMPWIQRKLATP
jgi:hypothetical protein